MKFTEQEIQLIKRIIGYIEPSNFTHAVWISPAQQLRNSADLIEQKERDVNELKRMIGIEVPSNITISDIDLTGCTYGASGTTNISSQA